MIAVVFEPKNIVWEEVTMGKTWTCREVRQQTCPQSSKAEYLGPKVVDGPQQSPRCWRTLVGGALQVGQHSLRYESPVIDPTTTGSTIAILAWIDCNRKATASISSGVILSMTLSSETTGISPYRCTRHWSQFAGRLDEASSKRPDGMDLRDNEEDKEKGAEALSQS